MSHTQKKLQDLSKALAKVVTRGVVTPPESLEAIGLFHTIGTIKKEIDTLLIATEPQVSANPTTDGILESLLSHEITAGQAKVALRLAVQVRADAESLRTLIDNYGRACRRDGNPAWESDEGRALSNALSQVTSQPSGQCIGCEGKPSTGNSPCAVCGRCHVLQEDEDTEQLRFEYMLKYNARSRPHQVLDERDNGDPVRYEYLLTCDYIAAKKYLPNLDEKEWKEKLRAKHDAAIALIGNER